jgi:ADP-ribose pyrophosphatase YjhB (NUDIX family)
VPGHNPDNLSCSNLSLRGDAHDAAIEMTLERAARATGGGESLVNWADPECSPIRVASPLSSWELSKPAVSAAAVLIDRGQVLLAHMQRRGWVFPGGRVEWNEPVKQTVVREVREETGLVIRVASLHGVYDLIGDKDAYGVPIDPYHKVVTAWRCVLDPCSDRDPTVQLSELREARWFDYGEVCFLRDHGHLALVGADIFRDLENFS